MTNAQIERMEDYQSCQDDMEAVRELREVEQDEAEAKEPVSIYEELGYQFNSTI